MGKKELLARTLERTKIGPFLSGSFRNDCALVVFNYHRIGVPGDSPFDHALWSASQDEFARQVRFLKRNFDVVRIDDLDDVFQSRRSRAVLLTFDDGYRDNYDLAFPVLRSAGAAATFFLATGFLDNRTVAWWDEIAWIVRTSAQPALQPFDWSEAVSLPAAPEREPIIQSLLRIYKSLSPAESVRFIDQLAQSAGTGRCPAHVAFDAWMTWDMVREMDQGGMDFGGHTVTHPVLSTVDVARQATEINQSKQRIEAELGRTISAFSYPVGQQDSFTSDTKRLLQEAGYRWAFSFFGGACRREPADPYALSRVAVSPHLSQDLFRSTARFPRLFA